MKPDFRPTVIVDTREQTPLVFQNLPSITGTLTTGDYSIAGCQELFAIERKTVADLVSCCTGDARLRFERELHRLRGFRFKRLLIVGARCEIEQARYRSNIAPSAVLGSISAWEVRFDLPPVFEPMAEAAAVMVERWAHYFAREICKTAAAIHATQTDPSPNQPTNELPA